MTKTTIIGYPRIGTLRELKFWTEDYFKGEISQEKLKENAYKLRKKQWAKQKEKGLDLIPSNDFSFYDILLDTSYMLNAIQKQYKDLELSELDTYFAMARGYQGEKGDVKALSMKKWFNTNYHYIVPAIDKDTEIKLNSKKPVEDYLEALEYGIKTKPTIIGPFTFLKLTEYYDNKSANEYVESICKAYKDLIEEFKKVGVEWLQIEEPSLVTDLVEEDKVLFTNLYSDILAHKENLKVILQTYYGDVRDIYKEICSLDFDGIGLDFIEGEKNIELIENNGFPKEKYLFVGVVNGKNIWRNDYEKTLNLLNSITKYIDKENIVINSSCSLLHVPYTLDNEDKMDEGYKKHLAFAEEKLDEFSEIKELFLDDNYKDDKKYIDNVEIIKAKQSQVNLRVKSQVDSLTEEDFTRLPAFEERANIQKGVLNLPILPTTTIGSLPQTKEVRVLRSKLKSYELTNEQYEDKIKQKIYEFVKVQEEIGLDVIVHGEYERNDMVEYFGQNLSGYLFTQKAWVQSYGTRCLKPPVIWEDITREKAFTVEWSKYAQSLTNKPVKGMLTGPVTILNWSFPREDISRREMALQIALAMREEVLDLEANGIKIIQIDEAALKEKLPIRRVDWNKEYLDWAIKAFRLLHSGVKADTQIHTHMCYSEFDEIVKDIDNMDADVITFEASRSNLSLIDILKSANFRTAVGPGVYDVHSPRVPNVEEFTGVIKKILDKIDNQKVWINPDCGLKTRGEEETINSLKNMVNATLSIRKTL